MLAVRKGGTLERLVKRPSTEGVPGYGASELASFQARVLSPSSDFLGHTGPKGG